MPQCDHPDEKVRSERISCGCMRIKCYACSVTHRFRCNGHGGGRILENAGRKKR